MVDLARISESRQMNPGRVPGGSLTRRVPRTSLVHFPGIAVWSNSSAVIELPADWVPEMCSATSGIFN